MLHHPARIYIDETYGDGRSFLIQAGIGIPAGDADTAFSAILERKIAENPRFDRQEFKGNKIAARNQHVFQWFLQQVVNIIAEIADATTVRTVITVDSMEHYQTHVYDELKEAIGGQLRDCGYPSEEIEIAREFIRQFIWLHARLALLLPADGIGDVEIYCDEKHCLNVRFEESLSAWVPINGVRMLKTEKRWQAYTRLFRFLLKVMPATKVFPGVVKFTYIDSTANYLIQAADLFSNLTLNAIRHRMGVTSDLVYLKYQMLCSVMDKDPIDAELLKSFSASDGELRCINAELFSRINLTS